MLTSLFSIFIAFSLHFTDLDRPTIILINGVPHLVMLTDDAHITEIIQTVPYYFTSELSHEQIVAGLIEQKDADERSFYTNNVDYEIPKEEVDILENAEFIKFIPGQALLDQIAVDRIRQISNDYVDGSTNTIRLEINHRSDSVSKLLADNRINSVRDLLVAFGVDEQAIESKKNIRDNLETNPFVRVNYKKAMR